MYHLAMVIILSLDVINVLTTHGTQIAPSMLAQLATTLRRIHDTLTPPKHI
jgi:hypothetical protein